jgi:aspartate aminotransferase
MSSIWRLTDEEVPGIAGRRVSLESASKVFNACGLRIGAIITDNEEYHRRSVAEFTANLCPAMIDQYIFGGLAHVQREDLEHWYAQQRAYYQPMLSEMVEGMTRLLPGVIISKPESSIYSVADVRNMVKPGFDALDFVMYCAREGKVDLDRRDTTLLVAPMAGFYGVKEGEQNPGATQMRIAYVASPDEMRQVPWLFSELLKQYESQRG